MDDATLASVEVAFSASPDNVRLRSMLLDAYRDRGDTEKLSSILEGVDPTNAPSPEDRRAVARALLALERASEALAFLTDDDPESLLVRARAELATGDHGAARETYRCAVDANATLEDPDLEAKLNASTTVKQLANDRRLRVVSNDDTQTTEVDRMLHPPQPPVSFRDVGGLEALKQQIRKRIITPFQKPGLFAKFRRRVGGGLLMYGPPGCGKTLLARATAGECDAEFINVAISDVLDMYIGESEQKLAGIFERARSQAPTVLFFDEIEALGGRRQYTREATSSKLVSQFLAEMDGFAQSNQGVLILGATNVPWAVDAAFRRPGRFDRVLFVPPPDLEARKAILELELTDRPTGADIDLSLLAKRSSGFSGADLRELVETAVDGAIEASMEAGHEVPVSGAHLFAAFDEVRPTTLEWLTTARNYARYANEAGQYDEVLQFIDRHGAKR